MFGFDENLLVTAGLSFTVNKFYASDFDEQELYHLRLQLEFYKVVIIRDEKF